MDNEIYSLFIKLRMTSNSTSLRDILLAIIRIFISKYHLVYCAFRKTLHNEISQMLIVIRMEIIAHPIKLYCLKRNVIPILKEIMNAKKIYL